LLIPQSSKIILAQKPQRVLEKIGMYCTNCHKKNDNVETCKVKRKEDLIVVSKVTTQHIKVQRLIVKYSCHICGDTRHKIIDCLKYNDMQNMFKNKGVKPIEKQVMVEPKVSNPLVHMVDVNMAITKNKVIKKQVFKDREPIKKKYIVDWEKEQNLHQYFVKTIQEMQTEDPPQNLIPKEKAQWSTSWVRLPESKVSTELIVSQSYVYGTNIPRYQ
jgi:hypothetical protein